MRTKDYYFVEFDDTEFFYPWAGFPIGALCGYPVLSTSLGQSLRRFVRVCYWSSIPAVIGALVLADWLHSLAAFVAVWLVLEIGRFVLLRRLLHGTPRLPVNLSLHLFAQHVGESHLWGQEIVGLFFSAFMFLSSAHWISPIFNGSGALIAVFLCLNSILACLARRQLAAERAAD